MPFREAETQFPPTSPATTPATLDYRQPREPSVTPTSNSPATETPQSIRTSSTSGTTSISTPSTTGTLITPNSSCSSSARPRSAGRRRAAREGGGKAKGKKTPWRGASLTTQGHTLPHQAQNPRLPKPFPVIPTLNSRRRAEGGHLASWVSTT